VLGSLLLDNGHFPAVLKHIGAEDFYRDHHQIIFRAMVDIYREGKGVDCVTLAEELMLRDQFVLIGGHETLLEISTCVPHAVMCIDHAVIVRQKSIARITAQGCTEAIRDTYSGLYTPQQVMNRLKEYLQEIPIVTPDRWSALSNDDMGMRLASSIKPKRIEWLMPDRIPKFAYTLIAGEGKQGKSQLTMALGALFSNGGEWWDGSGQAEQGHVLYLSAEDDAERAIRPRLEALEANLDQITILEARYKILSKDDKEPLIEFAELGSLEYWREVFRRIANPLVIFIDPLPSYIGRGVNDRKNSEVRAVLGPFIALAVEFGMTVVGVTHLGKSIDATKPIANRVLDSIAYTNLARAVHFVAKDPENADRKFFMPGPCNYAPGELESLAFTLVERDVTTEDGETITVAIADFEPGTVAVKPEDVVSVVGSKKFGRPSKVARELAEWLYRRLDGCMPVAAGLLYNEAAEAFAHMKPNPLGTKGADGLWSKGRNLTRAADIDVPELPYPMSGKRVDKYRDSDQGGRWYWRLVSKDAAF
jgi:hypothetical protein